MPIFLNNLLGFLFDLILLVILVSLLGKNRVFTEAVKMEYKSLWIVFLFIPVAISFIVFGPHVGIVFLAFVDFVILLPQFIITFKASSLAGLSIWSWVFRFIVSSGWLVYGFGVGKVLGVSWAFLMLPVYVGIIVKIWLDRRASRV